MPCASPLSRHFVAPPALVCDPLLGLLVVRITRCRGRSSLASGNNASTIGHANPLVVRCRGVWPDWFILHQVCAAVPSEPTKSSNSPFT